MQAPAKVAPATPAVAITGPALAVPSPQALIVMIRSAILALHNANLSGNFTVMHDLASQAFQKANSPALLGEVFAPLRAQRLDLSVALLLTPELTMTPVIN